MVTRYEIKKKIIKRLVRRNKWGGSHTEKILGGLSAHLKGSKIVKEAVKELISAELIIPKMKTGEIHYSLNPRKMGEILKFYNDVS